MVRQIGKQYVFCVVLRSIRNEGEKGYEKSQLCLICNKVGVHITRNTLTLDF